MGADMTQIPSFQFFILGGPVMWPILLCSIFALAVIIERIFVFRSMVQDIDLFKEKVFFEIRRNNIKEALVICDNARAPLAVVIKAGLVKFGATKAEIAEAMQEAAKVEIPQLEKGLTILSTIAGVAPLLGLLGSVLGLCEIFHVVQMRFMAANPVTSGYIAGGVWQSLITTIAGLLVGIPVLIAHNFLVTWIISFVQQIEKVALDCANFMVRISDGAVALEKD